MIRTFYVTAQLAGSEARTETLHGVPHRVVSATLVRNQVLVNNIGRCYLPAEAFTEEWAESANGAPVLVDHPTMGGQDVSGRRPDVINSLGVGWLFNVVAESDQLTGEVWLNESRADEVEDLGVILQKLDDGEIVEVSTGFPALGEKRRGVFNGEPYEIILYPDGFDHFAIFAEKAGACAVEDGCGLGVANARDSARGTSDIQFSGTETTPWGDASKDLAAFIAAYGTADEQDADVDDLSADTKSAIASRTILGDADAETAADLISVPVVNPSTDNLNEGALNAAAAAAGGARGADLADPDGIQATVDALREEHFVDDNVDNARNFARRVFAYFKSIAAQQGELSMDDIREMVSDQAERRWGGTNTWVWVAELFDDRAIVHVESQVGEDAFFEVPYTVDEEARTVELGEAQEVEKVTEFVPTENGRAIEVRHEYLAVNPTPQEGEMNREQLIDSLCECEDVTLQRETLEAMSDEELAWTANRAELEIEGEPANSGGSDEGGGHPPEPAAANEDDDKPPAWAKGLTEAVQQNAERLERLEQDTAPAREQTEQERNSLISEIAANSEYEEDELKDRSIGELRRLHGMATRGAVSFVGLGGPRKSDPSPKAVDLGFEPRSTLNTSTEEN